jgi:alanine racemase
MDRTSTAEPAAWLEIDLRQFRRNWDAITRYRTSGVALAYVVKDEAYGHGSVPLAQIALQYGVEILVVASVEEALKLRAGGLEQHILILGERTPEEYAICANQNFAACVGSYAGLAELAKTVKAMGRTFPIHLKIDTGMSRYGFRWSESADLFRELRKMPEIMVEGIMSHFAMSDELDKSFARQQLSRFNEVVEQAADAGLNPKYRHICNSGGFLDLPEAHFNLIRLGILPLGVYPSKACRRLEGIAPIMSVKSRVAAIKQLEAGDHVGYGMRFTAERKMRSAVIPIGYGLGYPRVRNQGHVLIHGKPAPIIGGVSMDAMTVDVSDIIDAEQWDDVTLLGRNQQDEITIHDIATMKNSVSYDAMVSWSARLPRRYIE